jgi:2,3-bisphosphoglycerate-dependent phosphoglycerate mutase
MRLFLIRHGYSAGNQDPANYAREGDPHVCLTDKGWEQAIAAGAFLKGWLARYPSKKPDEPLRLWSSTYKRTRETTAGLVYGLGGLIDPACKDMVRVSSRLIEMDFGLFSQFHSEKERMDKMPIEAAFYNAARKRAKFYAQPPMGESPMDVLHRVEPFIGTLQRDRERGAQDVVVVTHGVTLRALAMAYLHIDPDKYDQFRNPENASIYMIEGDRDNGYVFKQIYNGETGQEVDIDWGKKLAGVKIPAVPPQFRKPPPTPAP